MFGLLGTILGIILIIVGGFLVVFFPATLEHQSQEFSVVGIVLGLIFLIVGVVLIFVP